MTIESVSTAQGLRALGFVAGWRAIWHDLWRGRHLVLELMRREVMVRYRQSALGYAWAVVMPLVTVGVFTLLAHGKVLAIPQAGLPYPVFALLNVSLWQFFAGVVAQGTQSLTAAGGMVSRLCFPKVTLVMASIVRPLSDLVVRVPLIVLVMVLYGVHPGLGALLIPLLVIPMVLLGLGVAMVLAVLNLVLRDVTSALGVFLTYGMFLAPVMYPQPLTFPMVLVNFNPMSPFLIVAQDLMAGTALRDPTMLIGAVLLAAIAFLVGLRFFVIVLPRAIALA